MPSGFDNPFLDWLEGGREGRRATYGALTKPFATSVERQERIDRLFEQAEQAFATELGLQTLPPESGGQGGAPSALFQEFFQRPETLGTGGQQGGFNLTSRIARQAGLGADRRATYNPRTRFLYGI